MGKVSFEEAVEAQVIEEAGSKAVAVRPESQVAIAGEDPSKGIYGEFGADDIKLPRLNLVNKVGDLSNTFTPGTWVLNKEHQLTEISKTDKSVGEPLRVIVARYGVEYRESLPFDSEVRPRVFTEAEQVRLAGGVVTYEKGENRYSKIGHIEFFIQEPEGLSDEATSDFFYVFGDKRYARAIYTASVTAYPGTVKVVYTAHRQGHLRKTGPCGGFFLLGSKITVGKKGTWWIPSMKTAGEVPAELQEEIKALL